MNEYGCQLRDPTSPVCPDRFVVRHKQCQYKIYIVVETGSSDTRALQVAVNLDYSSLISFLSALKLVSRIPRRNLYIWKQRKVPAPGSLQERLQANCFA